MKRLILVWIIVHASFAFSQEERYQHCPGDIVFVDGIEWKASLNSNACITGTKLRFPPPSCGNFSDNAWVLLGTVTGLPSNRGADSRTEYEYGIPPQNYCRVRINHHIGCKYEGAEWDNATHSCQLQYNPVANTGKPEPGTCPVGNPINQATGNKYQEETDYTGAGPFLLAFQRFYNSDNAVTSTDDLRDSLLNWLRLV